MNHQARVLMMHLKETMRELIITTVSLDNKKDASLKYYQQLLLDNIIGYKLS